MIMEDELVSLSEVAAIIGKSYTSILRYKNDLDLKEKVKFPSPVKLLKNSSRSKVYYRKVDILH